MLDRFNSNAKLNSTALEDFSDVFDDINLGNSSLGNSTAARAKSLATLMERVDSIDFMDTDGHDVLGDVYEYLISQFASSSGKKAGEFYTPHEVSRILAKLVTIKAQDSVQNTGRFTVYEIITQSLIQFVFSSMPRTQKGAFEGKRVQRQKVWKSPRDGGMKHI